MATKVYAINLGSSSTKVAYAQDGAVVYKETIVHSPEDFYNCASFFDQEPVRMAAILKNMAEHSVRRDELDAVVSRGGLLQPLPVGVHRINAEMVDQLVSCKWGRHPCSVGAIIALKLCEGTRAVAVTADVPSSDELLDVARYSGLPDRNRRALAMNLNSRAMVREWASAQGKAYEDVNAITTGLGGGINTIAHCHGRMIDTNNSVDGEGCFSTNRCLSMPIDELIADCFSGEWDYESMMRRVSSEGGLMGYLGTIDMRQIQQRIEEGDGYADEVVDAMCYQVAKDIGAFATTMCGDVDVIVLSGGMAHCDLVTSRIAKRVSFIAPVHVRPGELEMEVLCESAHRAVAGELAIQDFSAAKSEEEAIGRISAKWASSDWVFERTAVSCE